MIRVYVVVEGQTEEAVVKSVLVPHLSSMGVYLFPIIVKISPGHKGGGTHWTKWENDIRNLLKPHKRKGVRVTTLFDLFRLPKGFPGVEKHAADTNTIRRSSWQETSCSSETIPCLCEELSRFYGES